VAGWVPAPIPEVLEGQLAFCIGGADRQARGGKKLFLHTPQRGELVGTRICFAKRGAAGVRGGVSRRPIHGAPMARRTFNGGVQCFRLRTGENNKNQNLCDRRAEGARLPGGRFCSGSGIGAFAWGGPGSCKKFTGRSEKAVYFLPPPAGGAFRRRGPGASPLDRRAGVARCWKKNSRSGRQTAKRLECAAFVSAGPGPLKAKHGKKGLGPPHKGLGGGGRGPLSRRAGLRGVWWPQNEESDRPQFYPIHGIVVERGPTSRQPRLSGHVLANRRSQNRWS